LPEPLTAVQPGILQRKCASCNNHTIAGGECKDCGNKKSILQKKSATNSAHTQVPPIVNEVLNSSGRPLDTATRSFMEPRFEHDFSGVRVHTDAKAAESASAVNALAYTVGRNVVFGSGQYTPGTSAGQRLLAHELTHVVQQGDGPSLARMAAQADKPDSIYENIADKTADSIIQGRPLPAALRGGAGARIQRQQAGAEEAKPPARTQEEMQIQPGDVIVRAGTFSGKNPLVQIIGEQYNHGGVALDSSTIHHVESNGYETVSKKTFFDPANAAKGAVIRFVGPFSAEIRARVVEIAKAQRYKKIPGNPFSTAEDLKTVNCNEFVHELFRQAITELTAEAQETNPQVFQKLLEEYGDPAHAEKAKNLMAPKNIEFTASYGDQLSTGLAVRAAEVAGGAGVSKEAKARGEVKVSFEGRLETRNLYPKEYAKSWNPFKLQLYSEGFYTTAVIRTYTPDSFINSSYFSLVREVAAGEK
jgi:hypothetical protein